MTEYSPTLFFPENLAMESLRKSSVAVLVSGGIESAFLVWALTKYFADVYPVYVGFGLVWEKSEQQFLNAYLNAVKSPALKPLIVFDMSVDKIYGKHWSTTGCDVPDKSTADEAVYLPGRNLLLLSKTAVWCALNEISYIALGSLGTNPFSDASPEFFNQLQSTFAIGLNFNITILRPLSTMHKENVISLARDLPLHLTFSCINPVVSQDSTQAALHCGLCNKCAERQQAFADAQIKDRTVYGHTIYSSTYSSTSSPVVIQTST